jgi:hypothetical protein
MDGAGGGPFTPALAEIRSSWWCTGDAELTLPAGDRVVFNTNFGLIENLDQGTEIRGEGTGIVDGVRFETVTPPAPFDDSPLGVFIMKRLWIQEGTIVTAHDAGLALLVCEDILIEGIIAANAQHISPGPGGSLGGSRFAVGNGPGRGGAGVGTGSEDGSGGGGGGYGGMGGLGGYGLAAGGNGGEPYGPTLVPLRGGSSGGGSSIGGGAGGGAVYLAAGQSIQITSGGINVGGGGGGSNPSFYGAGGGGSGGALLLEAPTIELDIAAALAANGGGGGGVADLPGQDGLLAESPAQGMAGGGLGGARGAVDGSAGSSYSGGGGGSGRIRFHTAGGEATISGVLSPAFEDQRPDGDHPVTQGTIRTN